MKMIKQLIFFSLEQSLNASYKKQINTYGASPKGVFWNSQSSQIARFDGLLSAITKITPVNNPRIADIGCGYGAMLDFIQKNRSYQRYQYTGYDINKTMIKISKERFAQQKNLFFVGKTPNSEVDFCLFSGTFNLCHIEDVDLWIDYIFFILQKCLLYSRCGLAFNLICGQQNKIQNKIFYADRNKIIERAETVLGPTFTRYTPNLSNDVIFMISKMV